MRRLMGGFFPIHTRSMQTRPASKQPANPYSLCSRKSKKKGKRKIKREGIRKQNPWIKTSWETKPRLQNLQKGRTLFWGSVAGYLQWRQGKGAFGFIQENVLFFCSPKKRVEFIHCRSYPAHDAYSNGFDRINVTEKFFPSTQRERRECRTVHARRATKQRV